MKRQAADLNATAGTGKMNGFYAAGVTGVAGREPSYLMSYNNVLAPTRNYAQYRGDDFNNPVVAVSQEGDETKRKQLYSQMNDVLIGRAFMLATATRPHIVVFSSKVHGLRYSGHEAMITTDTWIDR